MDANEAIQKLQSDPDIIITGPDCSDTNKLRVYADGGLIGKIYVGKSPNGNSELISPGYYSYSEIEGNKTKLENIVCSSKDTLSTLISSEYIEACKYAVERRFGKKKNDFTKQGEKERHVQTRIVKCFMNHSGNWCVADMEMQCPKKWFEGNKFSENTTKQPRFDMVVLNKDGIGIVELKVNNDNADNMESHYEHMEFLLTNSQGRKYFMDEIKRRIDVLSANGLISKGIDVFPMDRIWCGFLFVEGGVDGARDLARLLKGRKCVDQLKFLYHPSFDITGIDIDKSLYLDDFLRKRV